MKKISTILALVVFSAALSGCQIIPTKVDQTEVDKIPAVKSFAVSYQSLTAGPIAEQYKYSEPENYDVYSSSNPFYYDQSAQQYKCSKNNEPAEVSTIFPEPDASGLYPAGPSRISYYCPGENQYWIRDFPGNQRATVYGPFQGKPE
ncbi:hypothetical protein KJ840_00665 [Patescibacteria group bacterium]|nr:hypothetical protein [Patescibacteria group bacterium]